MNYRAFYFAYSNSNKIFLTRSAVLSMLNGEAISSDDQEDYLESVLESNNNNNPFSTLLMNGYSLTTENVMVYKLFNSSDISSYSNYILDDSDSNLSIVQELSSVFTTSRNILYCLAYCAHASDDSEEFITNAKSALEGTKGLIEFLKESLGENSEESIEVKMSESTMTSFVINRSAFDHGDLEVPSYSDNEKSISFPYEEAYLNIVPFANMIENDEEIKNITGSNISYTTYTDNAVSGNYYTNFGSDYLNITESSLTESFDLNSFLNNTTVSFKPENYVNISNYLAGAESGVYTSYLYAQNSVTHSDDSTWYYSLTIGIGKSDGSNYVSNSAYATGKYIYKSYFSGINAFVALADSYTNFSASSFILPPSKYIKVNTDITKNLLYKLSPISNNSTSVKSMLKQMQFSNYMEMPSSISSTGSANINDMTTTNMDMKTANNDYYTLKSISAVYRTAADTIWDSYSIKNILFWLESGSNSVWNNDDGYGMAVFYNKDGLYYRVASATSNMAYKLYFRKYSGPKIEIHDGSDGITSDIIVSNVDKSYDSACKAVLNDWGFFDNPGMTYDNFMKGYYNDPHKNSLSSIAIGILSSAGTMQSIVSGKYNSSGKKVLANIKMPHVLNKEFSDNVFPKTVLMSKADLKKFSYCQAMAIWLNKLAYRFRKYGAKFDSIKSNSTVSEYITDLSSDNESDVYKISYMDIIKALLDGKEDSSGNTIFGEDYDLSTGITNIAKGTTTSISLSSLSTDTNLKNAETSIMTSINSALLSWKNSGFESIDNQIKYFFDNITTTKILRNVSSDGKSLELSMNSFDDLTSLSSKFSFMGSGVGYILSDLSTFLSDLKGSLSSTYSSSKITFENIKNELYDNVLLEAISSSRPDMMLAAIFGIFSFFKSLLTDYYTSSDSYYSEVEAEFSENEDFFKVIYAIQQAFGLFVGSPRDMIAQANSDSALDSQFSPIAKYSTTDSSYERKCMKTIYENMFILFNTFSISSLPLFDMLDYTKAVFPEEYVPTIPAFSSDTAKRYFYYYLLPINIQLDNFTNYDNILEEVTKILDYSNTATAGSKIVISNKLLDNARKKTKKIVRYILDFLKD